MKQLFVTLLSTLPRTWLQQALTDQWSATLSHGEAVRLSYWGATGNSEHHPFAWADRLNRPPKLRQRADAVLALLSLAVLAMFAAFMAARVL